MKRNFLIFFISLMAGCSSLDFPNKPTPSQGVFSLPGSSISQVHGDIRAPYDSVCRFKTFRSKIFLYNSTAISSGALLPHGIFLSAGHNFYSPWYNRVISFKYECGIGSKAVQEPVVRGNDPSFLTIIPSYYKWRNFSSDVAAIKLCNLPAKMSSSFRLGSVQEIQAVSSGLEIYTSGYPAAGAFTGSILTHLKTKIAKVEDNVIHYEFESTHKGMSGSPVWILKGNERVIIGVHVKNGGAYLLEPAFINLIENLKNSDCE